MTQCRREHVVHEQGYAPPESCTQHDSDREIDDLRGRSIAFQNRSSTSAYFVPATELLELGVPMEILLSPMDRPAPGSIGYVFARSELNLSSWVHKRLVDAGAMSNLDWEDERRVPPSYKRDFVVVRETPAYPRARSTRRATAAATGPRPNPPSRCRQTTPERRRRR